MKKSRNCIFGISFISNMIFICSSPIWAVEFFRMKPIVASTLFFTNPQFHSGPPHRQLSRQWRSDFPWLVRGCRTTAASPPAFKAWEKIPNQSTLLRMCVRPNILQCNNAACSRKKRRRAVQVLPSGPVWLLQGKLRHRLLPSKLVGFGEEGVDLTIAARVLRL